MTKMYPTGYSLSRSCRRGRRVMPPNPLAANHLSLLADFAGCFHFGDRGGRERFFAGSVAFVDGDGSDLVGCGLGPI